MTIRTSRGEVPTTRANYKWVAEYKIREKLNKLGIGGSKITFNCGYDSHDIYLKGVHIGKGYIQLPMDKARLMRKAGNKFFFLFDLSEYGVNEAFQKRGGYYLYTFAHKKGTWKIKRHFYSLRKTQFLGLDKLKFHNVFWRVLRYCYYGVTIEEDDRSDNSS